MKVNISGRGVVPGMGVLAPVYGVEMSKDSILRFLNFQNFKLFETSSGALITRSNLEEFFKPKSEKPVKKTTARKTVAKKKEEPKKVVEEPKQEPVEVEEKPVLVGVDLAQNNDVDVDATEKEVAETFINDVAAVEDQLPENENSEKESDGETTTDVEEAKDETTEDEAPAVEDSSKQYNTKKKYKKNRH